RRGRCVPAGDALVGPRRLVAGLRGAAGVREDIEQEPERDDDPLTTVDPDDGGPDEQIGERRPGQEEEAEQGPHPRAEREINAVAEDPPDQKGDSWTEETGGENQTAHQRGL